MILLLSVTLVEVTPCLHLFLTILSGLHVCKLCYLRCSGQLVSNAELAVIATYAYSSM